MDPHDKILSEIKVLLQLRGTPVDIGSLKISVVSKQSRIMGYFPKATLRQPFYKAISKISSNDGIPGSI